MEVVISSACGVFLASQSTQRAHTLSLSDIVYILYTIIVEMEVDTRTYTYIWQEPSLSTMYYEQQPCFAFPSSSFTPACFADAFTPGDYDFPSAILLARWSENATTYPVIVEHAAANLCKDVPARAFERELNVRAALRARLDEQEALLGRERLPFAARHLTRTCQCRS